jgi:hypothetical protein
MFMQAQQSVMFMQAQQSVMFMQAQQPVSPAAPVAATLSLETLARSQNFDGSFPADDGHIRLIMSGKLTPSVSSRISALSGDFKTQQMVWATILTLACLEKKFGNEKTSWELLEEKAKDYLDGALQDLGVDAMDTNEMVQSLIASALPAF